MTVLRRCSESLQLAASRLRETEARFDDAETDEEFAALHEQLADDLVALACEIAWAATLVAEHERPATAS